MYPNLFVLGLVGFYKLRLRRENTLAVYVVELLRGLEHNSGILGHLNLYVPERYVWWRRRPPLLAIPVARTNLQEKAPLARVNLEIIEAHKDLDIFSCLLSQIFTRPTRVAIFIEYIFS